MTCSFCHIKESLSQHGYLSLHSIQRKSKHGFRILFETFIDECVGEIAKYVNTSNMQTRKHQDRDFQKSVLSTGQSFSSLPVAINSFSILLNLSAAVMDGAWPLPLNMYISAPRIFSCAYSAASNGMSFSP